MPSCAIVTGSSSGIGRAVARRLAADGFPVVLADVRREPLTGGEPTDLQITRAGGQCEFVLTDVSSGPACDSLVRRAAERFGRLDVLVNNAVLAGAHSKPLIETLDEDWDAMMAVNLRGPFLLCRAAVRLMLAQERRADVRGRIVNITSQHGMVGVPGHFAYSVGKGGLVQMTRQIAVEHGRDGIICNAVAPGKILTRRGPGIGGVRLVAHAVRAARRARGRRGRGLVSGLGSGQLHQWHQPARGRRMDGVLSGLASQPSQAANNSWRW